MVQEVYTNLPASRAEIKPHDFIYSINGIKTDKLNLENVYDLLSGTPGAKDIFLYEEKKIFLLLSLPEKI